MESNFIEACATVAMTGNTSKLSLYSNLLKKYLSISLYSPREGQFAMVAMDITDEKSMLKQSNAWLITIA